MTNDTGIAFRNTKQPNIRKYTNKNAPIKPKKNIAEKILIEFFFWCPEKESSVSRPSVRVCPIYIDIYVFIMDIRLVSSIKIP